MALQASSSTRQRVNVHAHSTPDMWFRDSANASQSVSSATLNPPSYPSSTTSYLVMSVLNPRSRRPLLRGIYFTDTGGSHPKKGRRNGKEKRQEETQSAI
ncbi:hypothetical protein K435DRAFT_862403 [Dendrothele bispora CBS 962.96]|uniref:Uncharacterized protein n=1 Tax=Dendrothele bispora (strain CBS 962.96) TaxID=1314807 RepID=A0A4S8LTV1_DENBC|nr:hypothetical protein K435DRAFT_862403 [Dendrothele bispora CBS 962.96]